MMDKSVLFMVDNCIYLPQPWFFVDMKNRSKSLRKSHSDDQNPSRQSKEKLKDIRGGHLRTAETSNNL